MAESKEQTTLYEAPGDSPGRHSLAPKLLQKSTSTSKLSGAYELPAELPTPTPFSTSNVGETTARNTHLRGTVQQKLWTGFNIIHNELTSNQMMGVSTSILTPSWYARFQPCIQHFPENLLKVRRQSIPRLQNRLNHGLRNSTSSFKLWVVGEMYSHLSRSGMSSSDTVTESA